MKQQTADLRIRELIPLIAPKLLEAEYALSDAAAHTVYSARAQIVDILERKDKRMLVVVGPCSIHDEKVALDYACRLLALREKVKDKLLIVMRVYFEKPRTTVGWKGFISDPYLDGSMDMTSGLRRARGLLLQIAEMGLPAGTEMLDPIIPQYTADLISWGAIGARTTESQTHREMSSGLSMPIGYKNATDGDINVAINALKAAKESHTFIGIDHNGCSSIVRTTGNKDGHIILRGGRMGPNYDPATLQRASKKLKDSGLNETIMVDCSHDNSGKIARNQELVCKIVINEKMSGFDMITGLMLESNIEEGCQSISGNPADLKYGVSITDECIGWKQTEKLLLWVHSQL